NRAMFVDQVVAISDFGAAMLENGGDVDASAEAIRQHREQLIDQAAAFFETREDAERYIDSLGLTPESIETSVELYGDEAAKQRIGVLQDRLGEIPEELATQIEAWYDLGDYARIEAALNQLARTRAAQIRITAWESTV